jgi:carboxymethylenebutenolidase
MSGVLVETDVAIATSDGTCDSVFIHPASGAYPAVIIWPDGRGLRPVFRVMGKRLAAEGYAVLLPNPFYRSAEAPGIPADFDFRKPDSRALLTGYIAKMTHEAIAGDVKAFVRFLDAQPSVRKGTKIGTQGYCMGGGLTMRTAAALPERIAAAGSFHGGNLATDQPTSPHLLVSKMKARYLFAIAANDDAADPQAKDKLREAFAAARLPAEVEVYQGALHGWCVADMPARDGVPIYDYDQAERAWSRLLALYRESLG